MGVNYQPVGTRLFWEVAVWIIARRSCERVRGSERLQRDSRLNFQTSVRSNFVYGVRWKGKFMKERSIKETVGRQRFGCCCLHRET